MSSSEDEKLISSSEDVKSRSSSEEDEKRKAIECEKRKRQYSDEAESEDRDEEEYEDSDDEEYEEKKRQKFFGGGTVLALHDGVYPPDEEEEIVDEDENRDDVDSYFTLEKMENTPVKLEECEVELTDEEKKFYIDKDYSGEVFHWATMDELKALNQVLNESEGFDCPFLPWSHYHGIVRSDISTPKYAMPIIQCAKCALDFYNKKYGSDFEFHRLVMSVTRPCAGIVYLITFKATSPSTGYTEIFQTKAFIRYAFTDLHIMMCRIKDENHQPLLDAPSN
jgi:hypothetical protein